MVTELKGDGIQMKRTFWKKLMAAALLGAFTFVPVVGSVTSAQADPPHRRDDNRRPGFGWGDRNHDHDKRDRRDRNRRDRDRWERDRRDRDRRDRDRRRPRPRPGWGVIGRNDYRTFTGVVSSNGSGSRFNIRVDGRVYNVTLSGRRPRGLDKDDLVRVYGRRQGDNNIHNASVRILRNR